MNIRYARQQDFPDIQIINQQLHAFHLQERADLFNDCYQNSIDQAYYNVLLISKKHQIIVVEDYNKIVGYAILEIKTNPGNDLLQERRYLLIDQMAILSSYWHQGLGKLLFAHIEETARRECVSAIELNVLHMNKKAVAFYQSMGMQVQSYRFEKLMSCKVVKE